MIPVIRPYKPGDVEAIVANPRLADVAEMEALGFTFEKALRQSVDMADWTACGTIDGEPVCMFGVAPVNLLGGIGAPWMLGSQALDAYAVPLLRHSDRVTEAMLLTYPRLVNLVDERNKKTIRWLRWLGFKFDEDAYDIGAHRFRIFRLGDW